MGKSRKFKRAQRLTRFFLICLASIFLCPSAKTAGNLIVYDLIPDLFNFLRIAPEEKESRAKLFAQLIIRPHPEIYDRPQIFKTDIGTLEQYLDGLAKFHGADARLPVILSHELFHVYHFQVNPLPRDVDQVELYRLIWQEGLAT